METDFNKLLLSFKEHLQVKNYSPKSILSYSQHLSQFFAYLMEAGATDIKRITRDILKDYQLRITTGKGERVEKYSSFTVSVKIKAIKRFFEYLEETNVILINPAEHIKEPKRETRLPRAVLTESEARMILDRPNLSEMVGIRDRTVLEVFYSTGIRLEELVNLTIYDCDLQGGLLRVNKGKFAKDRVVPLGKHAVRFIKEYITKVRPVCTRKNKTRGLSQFTDGAQRSRRIGTVPGPRLFVTAHGEPLSNQIVEIMVREYAREAGIKKKVTPHVFRHTFATELVRNGAEITAVQKMLGHSDLRVTHIYTKVAGVEVKKTHSGHHPREKDKTKEDPTPRIESIKGRSRRAA